MSSCFNGDWHARQLRVFVAALGIALLALAAGSATHAQTIDGDEPFMSGAAERTSFGTTPLRLGHRTEGFGQEASETAIGGRGATDLGGGIGFVDGQFRISNESRFGTNLGGGVRWYADDFLTGSPRILGISGWYDGQETVRNNYFNQGGVSFESLGEFIDLRLNANIPFEDEKSGDEVIVTGDLNFIGNSLAQGTLIPTDVALRVVDFEVAARVLDLNAWVYGGGYQFDGAGVSEFGPKGGVRGYITNDLLVDVSVTDDDVFGTNTVFQIVWTPGRTGAGPTSWIHTLGDRMREQVYRNTYIATQQVDRAGSIALTDAAGDALRIVHVASNAAADGDGTFERPLNSLTTIQGNSQQGDVILVRAGSQFTGQTATIINEQRLLGEGGGNTHAVVTSELGTVTLPETFAGALNTARPTITNNGITDSVLFSSSTADAATFSPMEVSNFDFFGGANAITSSTGVGAVSINRLLIDGTAGNAIDLTPITEILATTQRLRFSPNIDEVTFTNIGGDDIHLDAGPAPPATTQIVEQIVISDIESDDGDGVGINLINTRRAATITNIDWNGGASGLGALRIQNAGVQAGVTLNGTNAITGGVTSDPDNQGYAIKLVGGAAATHNITGTTIDDTGGDSIIVEGGASNMNFTGRINQITNATSILSVEGGHTGSLQFTELTADAGVIRATVGDGLQFDTANGVYTFNDEVEFIGTTSAVNVQDGSGVLTFTNGQFLNTTGATITFDGGTANMTFTGKIEQNQNALVLNVIDGHDGTLVFNDIAADPGVIEATNGEGLFFENADGAYTFNDKVTLNGGNAHIEIRGTGDAANGSEGTFNFVDADITNPSTDAAVIIDDSEAIFTYSGTIASNNADAVVFTNNSGGSATFNTTIDSTQGILIQDNSAGTILFADAVTLTGTGAGIRILENSGANVSFGDTVDSALQLLIQDNTAGTFAFTGQVTLTGTSNGVTILNNTGGSTSFNNIDITKTGAATGFVATSAGTGHTVTVTGNDNNITTATGVALNLNNIAAGGAGINFESVSSNGAANGIIINNVTGGPVNIGSGVAAAGGGGSILNSSGNAVVVTNSANVTLNRLNIDTATGDGIEINHSNGASNVTVTNTEISNTGALGIDYNRTGTANAVTRLFLTGNTIDATADEGIGIEVGGTSTANITINGNNQVTNSSGDEALAIATVGGAGKTLNLLVDGNSFTNSDATAATMSLLAGGTGAVNATVTNNTLTNNNAAGLAANLNSNGPGALLRLNLDANIAVVANAAATDYMLTETGGSEFRVQSVIDVDARNVGDVSVGAGITDDPGPIPQPQ